MNSSAAYPTVISISFQSMNDSMGSMMFQGDTLSDGGSKITERGVVYSNTNTVPTLAEPKQTCGAGTGSILC